jgi:hypothetical protein
MVSRPQHGDHDQVRRMVSLPADRDTVWAAIGGFGQVAEWHPLIKRAELTQIEGETYRHLTTVDGAEPGGCHVYWSAFFVPTGPDAHLADEIVGTFYEIGLRAIADRFGAPSDDMPEAPAR